MLTTATTFQTNYDDDDYVDVDDDKNDGADSSDYTDNDADDQNG